MAKKTPSRRKWTDAKKRAIVAEANQDGVTKSSVAAKHSITDGMLHNWTKKFAGDAGSDSVRRRSSSFEATFFQIQAIDWLISHLEEERAKLKKELR